MTLWVLCVALLGCLCGDGLGDSTSDGFALSVQRGQHKESRTGSEDCLDVRFNGKGRGFFRYMKD